MCASGAFTRKVPIQLWQHNGSSWVLIRTGTTGTGCGTWRDVPANRWLYVSVKSTTYGSYQGCSHYGLSGWYNIFGNTQSFYVQPYQSGRVDLQVKSRTLC